MLTVDTKKKTGPLNEALKDVKCEQTLIVIVCESNKEFYAHLHEFGHDEQISLYILFVELLSFSHLFVSAETEKKFAEMKL